MTSRITTLLLAAFFALPVAAQTMTIAPASILADADILVEGRTASAITDGDISGIHLDAAPPAGTAWIPGVSLNSGTIEVDIRGRDEPGQSFVGVAFAADTAGYEVIYLRPFNFRNEQRAGNSVQYAFEPDYPWRRLREEHPGKYEAEIDPAPDPTAWFHLRLELTANTVSAFVNGIEEPVLTVDRLSDSDSGKIGFWVGSGSEGDFANLRVTP